MIEDMRQEIPCEFRFLLLVLLSCFFHSMGPVLCACATAAAAAPANRPTNQKGRKTEFKINISQKCQPKVNL